MDLTLAFTYICVFGYLGVTIYMANQEHLGETLWLKTQTLLYAAPFMTGLLGLYAILAALSSAQIASLPEAERQQYGDMVLPEISTPLLLICLLLCGLSALSMLAFINSEEIRQRFKRLVGTNTGYDTTSLVHTTAVVFVILVVAVRLVDFLLAGGTDGLAETIETQGISASEPLFYAGLEVAMAFLGIGYAIRRGLPISLERLGLRWPTQQDIIWAVGALAIIFSVLVVYSIIVSQLVSEQTLNEQNQAAEGIAAAFSTLPLALLLAVSAAVGEEIFFRGALQPIFGLVPTTLFFTVLHIQLLFSPGILVIFIIGLIFGRLRQRQSTTAAIIAHFAYDLLLLVL